MASSESAVRKSCSISTSANQRNQRISVRRKKRHCPTPQIIVILRLPIRADCASRKLALNAKSPRGKRFGLALAHELNFGATSLMSVELI
jgi:hypothetical protein